MRFWFVLGTAAELIKMYPIIDEAQTRQIDWYLISTGQSGVNLWKQYTDFQFPENHVIKLLDSDTDLSSSAKALTWFTRAYLRSAKNLNSRLANITGTTPKSDDFWFVHGDTLSTLLGSVYGRRLNIPIVHVEAGMRSHDIWNPFPEEISRRIVSRLTKFHMAPDQNAANNLKNEGIAEHVTVTSGNTVLDALGVALKRFSPKDLPSGEYAVANIHRFENLSSTQRWHKIIDVLVETAQKIPLYLVMMPNTIEKLKQDHHSRERLDRAGVQRLKRLPFSQFVHFMHKAKFMVTDGGSNQQECFHLGLPCLILREKTESIEGIGSCCVLSQFDDKIIQDFLNNPVQFRREPPKIQLRPTDIIFNKLLVGRH